MGGAGQALVMVGWNKKLESGWHPLVVNTAWVGLAGAQLLNSDPSLPSLFDV